jgi:hypothetical protein
LASQSPTKFEAPPAGLFLFLDVSPAQRRTVNILQAKDEPNVM